MTSNHIDSKADTIDYDYENDSLFLFKKGVAYCQSISLDDVIIDFAEEGFIKGVEIQNASEKFNVSKYDLLLKNLHKIKIELFVSTEKITLNINLALKQRNKNIIRPITAADINDYNLPAGTLALSCEN